MLIRFWFYIGHTWTADFDSDSAESVSGLYLCVGGKYLFIKWKKRLPILVFTDLL